MLLLVEGGVTVANAFLKEGFADRLEIFTAPVTLGNAGRHGTGALALRNLDEYLGGLVPLVGIVDTPAQFVDQQPAGHCNDHDNDEEREQEFANHCWSR